MPQYALIEFTDLSGQMCQAKCIVLFMRDSSVWWHQNENVKRKTFHFLHENFHQRFSNLTRKVLDKDKVRMLFPRVAADIVLPRASPGLTAVRRAIPHPTPGAVGTILALSRGAHSSCPHSAPRAIWQPSRTDTEVDQAGTGGDWACLDCII